MPLATLPNDLFLDGVKRESLDNPNHGKLSRTWGDWMNNLKNLVNTGEPPSKDTDVTAAGGINLLSPLMRIQSATAGAITIIKNPQITAGYDGQEILIEGLSDVKTPTITTGNGLKLAGGASFAIGEDDTIKLHFNKAKNLWIEISRSDN